MFSEPFDKSRLFPLKLQGACHTQYILKQLQGSLQIFPEFNIVRKVTFVELWELGGRG